MKCETDVKQRTFELKCKHFAIQHFCVEWEKVRHSINPRARPWSKDIIADESENSDDGTE